MINEIMEYLKYPSKNKQKYSTSDYSHLQENKITLPITKNGKSFFFYDSGPLRSSLIDIRKELTDIKTSSKSKVHMHFNELKSSLSIEGHDMPINKISSSISNKEGIANSIENAYKIGFDNPVISKTSLITIFNAMQTYKIENNEYSFRKTPVYITDGINYTEKEKPENIESRIDELFSFVNNSSLDPILISFISHYIYEDIHPFYDFNGRTGRLLMNMIMINKTNKTIPFLSASINVFRKNYYKSFEQVEQGDDLTIFVLNLIIGLHKYIIAFKRALKHKLSPSLESLLTNIYLLDKRSFTFHELKDTLRITDKKASLHEKLRKLEDINLLIHDNNHTKR